MKTRLARGVSGRVFRRLFNKNDREAYTWAINLKPGDIFNSFDAWNHRVERVEVDWRPVWLVNAKSEYWHNLRSYSDKYHLMYGIVPNGTHVHDVTIISTDGMQHSISETGCIVPAWTIKQLRRYMGDAYINKAIEIGLVDINGVMLRFDDESDTEQLRPFVADPAGDFEDWFVPVAYPKLNTYKQDRRSK